MSGMLLSIPDHIGNCKAISEHFSVKFFNPKNFPTKVRVCNTPPFKAKIGLADR